MSDDPLGFFAEEWSTAGKRDTSRRAYESILDQLSGMRRACFDLAWEKGSWGITCDEAEVILQGRHQTISARFYDLHKHGLLVDAGYTRKTRSGRDAIVWFVPAHAPDSTFLMKALI